jgi:hypothetical protein
MYCGSANWYRYSLEESEEVVVRGPISAVPAVLDEWTSLWSRSMPDRGDINDQAPVTPVPEGYREEVPDPIAAAVLARVRGSFVLGQRKKR